MSSSNSYPNDLPNGATAYGDIEIADNSQLKIPDGSLSAPAISFNDDTDTGILRGGTNILDITTAGVRTGRFYDSGGVSTLTLGSGSASEGRLRLAGVADCVLSCQSDASLVASSASGIYLVIDSPGNETNQQFVIANNSGVGNTPSAGDYLLRIVEAATQAASQCYLYGGLILASETITGAGACSPITTTTIFDLPNTSAGSLAMSLADGAAAGQIKHFVTKTADGDDYATLTPTNLAGYSTITFNAAGETASLMFDGTNWNVLSVTGATLA